MTDLQDIVRTLVDESAGSLNAVERADPAARDEGIKSPDWSPDGRRFAYISGVWRGPARVVVVNASGEVERRLALPALPPILWKVRWSPDGRRLAISTNNPGSGQTNLLHVVDAQGIEPARTIATIAANGDFRWTPDSQRIYYRWQKAVHVVDVATTRSQEVYRPDPPWQLDPFSTFDLSRDGTELVLAVRNPAIGAECVGRVVTVGGGVRDLRPFQSTCRAIAWSHAEDAVIAAVHDTTGAIPLFTAQLQGDAPPVQLKAPRLQVVDISTSPDGSELLLGVGNPRPDFWTLKGFAAGRR